MAGDDACLGGRHITSAFRTCLNAAADHLHAVTSLVVEQRDVDRRQATIGTPNSNAGIRDVSIPPHLMSAVQHHVQDHVGLGKDALLFSTAKGEQIGRGGAFQRHWGAGTQGRSA